MLASLANFKKVMRNMFSIHVIDAYLFYREALFLYCFSSNSFFILQGLHRTTNSSVFKMLPGANIPYS